VDELRQLIARRRRLDAVPSGDIKACVERSPGRILMRVNVGHSANSWGCCTPNPYRHTSSPTLEYPDSTATILSHGILPTKPHPPIPSYTLGHDAVLRAVLRELAPDFFGEHDGVDAFSSPIHYPLQDNLTIRA